MPEDLYESAWQRLNETQGLESLCTEEQRDSLLKSRGILFYRRAAWLPHNRGMKQSKLML